MKIKGFLAFATGTVISTLCMPVVAQETGGLDIAALLSNINVAALLTSAPDVFVAFTQSAGIILQAVPQFVAAVTTNGFDIEAIIAEVTVVAGEVVVNIAAVVGATLTNISLEVGLLITLNDFVSDFLMDLEDPMDAVGFFDMSERFLTDGVTILPCEDTSYTFNFTTVTLGGFSSLEITELTINGQNYDDNEFNGDFEITVGNFDLNADFKGTIFEDKCGEMSTEEYDATHNMFGAVGFTNFQITGTIEGQNVTLTNLTIVEVSFAEENEELVLTPLQDFTDPAVSTALRDILKADVQVFKDYLEADFLNGLLRDVGCLPQTYPLPFPWPF